MKIVVKVLNQDKGVDLRAVYLSPFRLSGAIPVISEACEKNACVTVQMTRAVVAVTDVDCWVYECM